MEQRQGPMYAMDTYPEVLKIEGIRLVEKWRDEFGLFKNEHPNFTNTDRIQMSLKLIKEEADELEEAVLANDPVEIIDAVGDLYFVVTQMAKVVGVDPHAIVEEVYNSNMSKFASTEEIAIASVQKYVSENIAAHYIPYKNKFKIIRSEDGKLLKSLEFKEPDFKKLLEGIV